MTDDLARQTPAGPGRLVVPTRMRTAIARQMAASKREVPHFYVSTEIAMDGPMAEVRELAGRSEGGPRITVTTLLIHRLAATLVEHPAFNAVWTDEGLVTVDAVNVGVAIALDGGLIAPGLLGCAGMSLQDIAVGLDDLVARSRAGKLRTAELTGPTFTLSNLGMFQVTSFVAIVPPPQVGILAVGRSVQRPVVEDGAVTVRSIMTATLSADHRAVDGAQAARFLGTFKALVEGEAPAR
jgi:pyruvate dehydrogenase E2 component (dihydrolipoamide acetyltransferase)